MPQKNHLLSRSSRAPSSRFSAALKPLALAAVVFLVGCASIDPKPLTNAEIEPVNQADQSAMRKDVEPIKGALTLEHALARALKYNLDRRAKMMEEALALNQLDVNKYDMLPSLVAKAGYASRNNDHINLSRDAVTGQPSSSRFISQDRSHELAELGLTWNILDFGLGYYGAKQQSNRVLIAGEKRRKAMHLLIQDVRTAFWRAASAQKLRGDVKTTIATAQDALKDSEKVEQERIKSPLDSLRYQRQLLENLRLLEAINQELSSAQVELASLINAPLGQPIEIAEGDLQTADDGILDFPVQQLEEAALKQNADLREQHYNARIAREETRKTLVRMFPNLSLSYAVKYDSDNYLLNNDWNEAGLQLSFNLFNLLTGPTQMKLADAGVALAEQRRMAMQLSVLTQVHLARLQLLNARSQFARADTIFKVDQKIAELARNRESAQAQSKLERVSNDTSGILSLLRRYQALAQVQKIEGQLLANLGLEPEIGSTSELSLEQLAAQVKRNSDPWGPLRNPKPEAVKAEPVKAEPVKATP
jgi:outer membrane protein TolC